MSRAADDEIAHERERDSPAPYLSIRHFLLTLGHDDAQPLQQRFSISEHNISPAIAPSRQLSRVHASE